MSSFLNSEINKLGNLLHITALQNYGASPSTPSASPSDALAVASTPTTKVASPTPTDAGSPWLLISGVLAAGAAVWYFFFHKRDTRSKHKW